MATQQMYVDMASLQQLKSELEVALANFEKSIKDLKSGIDALGGEKSAFTGEEAMVFKQTFAGTPSETLEGLLKATRDTRDYMEQKIVAFAKTLGSINDIVSR